MDPNPAQPALWQRFVQRIAATRPGSWLFSHTLHHVDRFLMGVSGGRLTVPGLLAGLPVVWLTTTGAKTGKERTLPVLGLRDGDRWVVVASNWGNETHPAWYYNLRANPEVELTYREQRGAYVAREADPEEGDVLGPGHGPVRGLRTLPTTDG